MEIKMFGHSKRAAIGAAFLAVALVTSALPSIAATPTTGIWVFPHDHQGDALADSPDSSFYIGANSSAWIEDSYFADTEAGTANVQVDLYNPTSTDLSSVQLFAAISDDALFTSIDFSGGDGGDVSVPASDLGGGTPFLADGSTLPDHDVYPAFFTSYSVGDVGAGSVGIVTIWVNVTGDFAGGLIVHLDYAAVDSAGAVYTGPFEADMNLLENGESEEEPPCEESGISAIVNEASSIMDISDEIDPVIDFEMEVLGGSGAENVTLTATFPPELEPGEPSTGTVSGQVWVWSAGSGEQDDSWEASVPLTVSPTVLDGDLFSVEGELSWETCGSDKVQSTEFELEAASEPTGDILSAAWWRGQLEKTSTGKKNAEFDKTDVDGFLQAIAAHSEMFTYGDWDGTEPGGDADEGWLDIDSLTEALNVLQGKSGDSKKVRDLERQALGLWLNVASGAVNLDTTLEAAPGCDENDGENDDGDEDGDEDDSDSKCKSAFEQHTGMEAPGEDFDTPGEILAFAEDQASDWSDGNGSSKSDLRLARLLCKAVNREWLVMA